MQVADVVIALEIAVPNATDATAIPVPMIASIKAYSAAEAPLSFAQNVFINETIIYLLSDRHKPPRRRPTRWWVLKF